MKETIQYLPERHTDVTVELMLESPLDALAIAGVAVLAVFAVFAVWRLAVRRRRRR